MYCNVVMDGWTAGYASTMEDVITHLEIGPVRLSAIRYAAKDIHLFEFEAVDGRLLPAATAGAHIDIAMPGGLVRQYSLVCSEPAASTYTVAIKRDPNSRGGSAYMHDVARVGMELEVSAPRNHFPLVEDAPHTVLIAGGIGITPIWAMAQRLEELGRSWELHFACRARNEAAFLDRLADRANVRFHADVDYDGMPMDLAAIIRDAARDAHFYCCGPKPMLAVFEQVTAAIPSARVHVEYFAAKHEAALAGGFTVELARSGVVLKVPAGATILDVLREAGHDVAFACEQGLCGECETRVLGGVPDHRDSILNDQERAENQTMMICCSGAKSDRLILDI